MSTRDERLANAVITLTRIADATEAQIEGVNNTTVDLQWVAVTCRDALDQIAQDGT